MQPIKLRKTLITESANGEEVEKVIEYDHFDLTVISDDSDDDNDEDSNEKRKNDDDEK